MYVAYFHSFGTRNHTFLDRSGSDVNTIAEGSKGSDNRTKRILTRLANHHNSTGSPLRNPSRVPVRRDENINGAKGDQRFRYVN